MERTLKYASLSLVLAATFAFMAIPAALADSSTEDGERPSREEIRERMENFKENTERTVEEIDNGVVMTITSDDPEIVEKILERHEKHEARRAEREAERPEDAPEIEHTVEVLDNGIRVTVTSDDAEVVERLQEGKPFGRHHHRGPRGEGPNGEGVESLEG